METMTSNKRTYTYFRHREHVWCCLRKRFVQMSCRSLLCLPHFLFCLCLPSILLLRKELAYCQQHTESHYFTTDNTTGNTMAVCCLCAIICNHMHIVNNRNIWQVVLHHLSSNVITATQCHFKSNWAFLQKRQKTGVSREKNILTLS